MPTYNIAVLPGDGVGPEVVAESLKVLLALEEPHPDLRFTFSEHPVGAGCYAETGEDLPESTLEACKQADAVLFGSAGDPDVRFPDGTEIAPQLTLRFELDLYAGIRPIKKYRGVPPLLDGDPPLDYVILRENTEGLYASRGAGVRVGDSLAVDNMVITRAGTERIVRYAFEIARQRKGAPADGASRVTSVDKANILKSMAFFRQIYDEVAETYPDVERDYAYVDAFTVYQLRNPGWYDVVVAENMFGDIISDLAAATIGGMGDGAVRGRGGPLRRLSAVPRHRPRYRGAGYCQPHGSDPVRGDDAVLAGRAPQRSRSHRRLGDDRPRRGSNAGES